MAVATLVTEGSEAGSKGWLLQAADVVVCERKEHSARVQMRSMCLSGCACSIINHVETCSTGLVGWLVRIKHIILIIIIISFIHSTNS